MTAWKTLTKQASQARTLRGLIGEAAALVVGIGAGMSAADGFTYVGPRFEAAFADFIDKYHWFDMLQASLYDFADWEEYWAFQSRFVALNYLDQPVGRSYLKLRDLLDQKPHHIITTNADNAFWAAGYDPKRVFHIQGEYGLLQCSEHCHQQTYQNDRLIRRMVEEQEHMRVPSRLIPRCPRCGAPMEVNKRNEERGMVEDADFAGQRARYEAFLAHHRSGRVLYLEIGVGTTTPQFIKHPFWRMVGANKDALLVTLNHKDYRIPRQLRARSVHLDQNIASLIAEASQNR